MRYFFIKLIKLYQRFLSPILPKSCRYYPTCSEYAIWVFSHRNFFIAFYLTTLRILKCNQFFKGGIDYPTIKREFLNSKLLLKNRNIKPKFWFVPYNKSGNFYIIKSII